MDLFELQVLFSPVFLSETPPISVYFFPFSKFSPKYAPKNGLWHKVRYSTKKSRPSNRAGTREKFFVFSIPGAWA